MGILQALMPGDRGAQKNALEELEQARRYFEDIEVPDLNWFDYNPEAINYETVSEDPLVRSAQMSALEKMATLADTGLSAEDELGYYRAGREGAEVAQRGNQAALQNAQMRGVAGSGVEMAMRDSANQQGAQRAQELAMEKASDSARQRALYNQAYMQNLSGFRDQDFGNKKANTDIINEFNTRNTTNRNDAQKYNQEGRIGTQQSNFDNQMSRARGMAGQTPAIADHYYAKDARKLDQQREIAGEAEKGIKWLTMG